VDRLLPHLRLAFSDPALERDWWRWFGAERARMVRGGVALLLATMALFAVFDVFVLPELTSELLALRAVTLALLVLAGPAVFGRRSAEFLAAHSQEVILYLCVVAYGGLTAIGWLIAPAVTDERLFTSLMALMASLAGLYGVTGLRFRYAAPIGLGVTALFYAVAALRTHAPPEFGLASGMFGVVANAIGLSACWAIERHGRRGFLRGRELEQERRRSEELLLNVMPRAFADRLGAGTEGCVDRLAGATVLFGTVVGFDQATADRPPLEIVRLLDQLVGTFDDLAAACGVERIKTIGATYMAAAGVSDGRDDHAVAAARLAIGMREAVRVLAAREGLSLQLRVGLCAGPLVAGVIGRSRYAFDCWGDTANIAARLDTSGHPDRVQASRSVAEALGEGFVVVPRGGVWVKGKGEIESFWVDPR
jgi:class 3 adenylate cyclase